MPRNILSLAGAKIGSIGQVYTDDDNGQPTWATAKTGLFGTSESFVPLEGARIEGNDVVVPYTKDQVKDAPRVDVDGHLEPSEEERLYQHYQVGGMRTYTDATTGRDTDARGTVGRDTSGPTTDDAMTRSEERPVVEKETVPVERVRLDKDTVTDEVTVDERSARNA